MKTSMVDGLAGVVRSPGQLDLPTLRLLTFSYEASSRQKYTQGQYQNIDDLKNRIEEEIKSITRETLENVFDSILKRLKFCIDVNGNTFEQYL